VRLLFATLFALVLTGTQAPAANVRFATFNAALNFPTRDGLHAALRKHDVRVQRVAAIIQHVRPDVLLINELDYDAKPGTIALWIDGILGKSQLGERPIEYGYHFIDAVNTGVDSGLDLDSNGKTGEPGDAWGFGRFPGQYGMLVLSRFPIDSSSIRRFQKFLWSEMPDASIPRDPTTGAPYYPENIWRRLRLSSKSHWLVPIRTPGRDITLVVAHPTPPVFDGPDDHNGHRNHDEIRMLADLVSPEKSMYLVDDKGQRGGLAENTSFVIAGDMNADPFDGDSYHSAIRQLLNHPRVQSWCMPTSQGALWATTHQGGKNLSQKGFSGADTTDFNDRTTGNLRIDYVLPSRDLSVRNCGVFWPAPGAAGADWVQASDHRLTWLDVNTGEAEPSGAE